jgi:hypothetical protein
VEVLPVTKHARNSNKRVKFDHIPAWGVVISVSPNRFFNFLVLATFEVHGRHLVIDLILELRLRHAQIERRGLVFPLAPRVAIRFVPCLSFNIWPKRMEPLFFIFNVATITPHGVKLFLRQPNAQISTKISVTSTTPKHKRASEWVLDEVPKPYPIVAILICGAIEPPHISKAIVRVAGHTVLEVATAIMDHSSESSSSWPQWATAFLIISWSFKICFWVVASFWPNVSSRFAFFMTRRFAVAPFLFELRLGGFSILAGAQVKKVFL